MLNMHFYLTKIENPFQINPNYSRIWVFIHQPHPKGAFPCQGKLSALGTTFICLLDIKRMKKYSVQLGKLYFLCVDKNRFCLFQYICNNYIKS